MTTPISSFSFSSFSCKTELMYLYIHCSYQFRVTLGLIETMDFSSSLRLFIIGSAFLIVGTVLAAVLLATSGLVLGLWVPSDNSECSGIVVDGRESLLKRCWLGDIFFC